MPFLETDLEKLIIHLIKNREYIYNHGDSLERTYEDVLIEKDLKEYLNKRYKENLIEENEIEKIIL